MTAFFERLQIVSTTFADHVSNSHSHLHIDDWLAVPLMGRWSGSKEPL
jgi:hypothetical protein